MIELRSILELIREAGALPTDPPELRLKKNLLVSATLMISAASLLWLLIYWQLGPHISATAPFLFEALLWGNLLIYLKTQNFERFRATQLLLILCVPFIAQWSMGSFISASGISLWGLLAPVGALLFIGVRESIPWFLAYTALTIIAGMLDFLLTDSIPASRNTIPAQTAAFFFALNFSAVSTIVYFLLRHASAEKQKTQARLEESNARLQTEQDRSERLLLNILPPPIAERLKNSNQTIADGFSGVTVMFADIVNFTRLTEGLTPQQVFSMLNRVFYSFDELAEKHGVEKIKTIGDAYMVAGGLSQQRACGAIAVVKMALEMREFLRSDTYINHQQLDVRIGIATGPIVAGVVGKKKFIYDLWGDTVNIASRITSEAPPGSILIDATTHGHLIDSFDFAPVQTLHLKGKGLRNVYAVIGQNPKISHVTPSSEDRQALSISDYKSDPLLS